jgi:hypothetical protein
VSLVTAKFAEEAEFIARAAGMPDVPVLLLPHPIAGLAEEPMAAIAVRLVAPALALLSGEVTRARVES